jgi:hypothetical protein
VERFRQENERKLKQFLYFYADYWEQAYKSSQEEVARTNEGNGDIFGVWLRATIDDPKIRASHKVLEEAVQYLKAKHWQLYMRIKPAFFSGPDSKPWLPETWKDEALHDSLPDQLAYKDYLESIVHMMDYIEARLPQFQFLDPRTAEQKPLQRLKMPKHLPDISQYERRSSRRPRRKEALEKVLEYREDLPDHIAIQLAAQHTGYSAKEIRVIIRQHNQGRL